MSGAVQFVLDWWAVHGIEWLAAIAALSLTGAAALRYSRLYRQAIDSREATDELIDNLSEGIYRSSLTGRMISANKALVRLNGYTSEAELLGAVSDIGGEWYVEPKQRAEFRSILDRQGYVSDFVSEVYRHKTRERIWISESARLVRDKKSRKPLYFEGSVREVTETVVRLRLEEQFRKLTSHLPGGLFQIAWDPEGSIDIVYLSEGFHNLVDVQPGLHMRERQLFHQFVHPDDRDGYVAAFGASHDSLGPIDHEFRIISATGREKWLRITAKPEKIADRTTWYGYVSDISLRKRQALEIEELAFYDPLTKLPNRRLLLERIGAAMAKSAGAATRSTLLFIDLDNFKSLNDTQGHDVGDQYLVEIAARLRRCVRESDTVARMGGDEFVVILESLAPDDASTVARAIVIANQMLAALRVPFERGEIRHSSSASIGMVTFGADGVGVDEILKRADIAMYQAKAAGRDSAALFEASWMAGETERFALLGELRRAIADETLMLYYQPQVDRIGQVAGAEALLRWRHPTLGMIPPDLFIPLAEQSGLMSHICRFVLQAGAAKLAAWRDDPATSHLRLSVNVSVQSFSSPDFVRFIEDVVAEHDIDCSRLTIEFTEHVMAKDQRLVARQMRQLKELGLRFSLDDFGTGYSSLARLKSLPFDEVKIDGGFVADIETSEGDRALIRTILAMANTLGIDAVAEHVETRNQEAFLHAFGCDLFQGYLYGPGLDDADFAAYLAGQREPKPDAEPARLTA